MNIILFITIIVLLLIFVYQIILFHKYNKNEPFKSRLNNQITSFLDDKSYYDIRSDTNFINISKIIELNPVEFQNFCNRVDIYNNVKEDRLSDTSKIFKKNLINYEEKLLKNSYPIVRREISVLKLDQIILKLLKKYKFNEYSLNKNKNNTIDKSFFINVCKKKTQKKSILKYEDIESYRFIKNWILESISREAANPEYAIKFVDIMRFKFKYDKVIDYFIDYKNHLERFVFNGVLHRENKEHNFFIYFDIIFDYKNIEYFVNDIIIMGVNIEQYIIFADLLNKDYDYDKNGTHLSLSNENSGYVTDDYINNYWETVNNYVENDIEERRKKNNTFLHSNGTCFFKEAPDKDNCISFTEKDGTGVWDTPCKFNEDCPFYKKNSNYPNKRGGCNNGFCEMPINIDIIGYKEYNENNLDKAVCHNCIYKQGCVGIQCSQCCEDQNDSLLYPDLNSPDYAFPNDYKERIANKQYFEENNLSPYKILI